MASRSLRRIVSFSSGAAFLVAAVALLLADRAVAVLGPFRSLTLATGRAIERTLDVDLLDRSDIPASVEQFGHATLWGTGMVVFGWIFRAHIPLVLITLFVAGASVVFEAAQPVLSATRRFEVSDAMANFAGIAAAVVFLSIAVPVERRLSLARAEPARSAHHHRRK